MAQHNKKLTVLLVDDDSGEHVLIERHAAAIESLDLEVIGRTTSVGGLDVLAARSVDVVLLDYYLGADTGITVLEAIRSAGYPDVPVVFLTGMGDEQLAVTAMQAGAVDYMPKAAVSTNSLERVLRNAVERGRLKKLLEQHRASLERTNADLARRNRAIEGFYHTVSHELKTPLSAIHGFLSLVCDGLAGDVSAEASDYLELAQESCGQMGRCIDDMLEASRLETGKLSVVLAPTDAAHVMKHAVESLRPLADEHGVALRLEVPAELAECRADAHRLGQVLRNLINNAVKFTPRGGCVTGRIEQREDSLWLAVADTGRGIPADHLSSVFDRLHQVRAEDSATAGGLGLGLSICKELVELHGGQLAVESEVGRGSVFSFSIELQESRVSVI